MQQQTSQPSAQELAAQKAYKQSKDAFKKQIKEMAAAQKELTAELHKPHGSIPNASMAQTSRRLDRAKLREYYIAYAVFRAMHGGYTKLDKVLPKITTEKSVNSIIKHNHFPKNVNGDKVVKIYTQYAPKVTVPFSKD